MDLASLIPFTSAFNGRHGRHFRLYVKKPKMEILYLNILRLFTIEPTVSFRLRFGSPRNDRSGVRSLLTYDSIDSESSELAAIRGGIFTPTGREVLAPRGRRENMSFQERRHFGYHYCGEGRGTSNNPIPLAQTDLEQLGIAGDIFPQAQVPFPRLIYSRTAARYDSHPFVIHVRPHTRN